MYVIGTAGHVDHGKSTLVRALTGIDPDRLTEEKERGMTIDLGFAWLRLPSGREVSIVDVPGHERFIKNMLAGVGGIDLAMLVIAADEGVMPQTSEHLAILDLLQIRSGVVVVTKQDLVDEEWLELVIADIAEAIKPTTLAGAPILTVSSTSREGLPELLATLDRLLEHTEPKRDLGQPRLPIDRVFTIAGFGTVVTGTLIDGSLAIGEEIEVAPGNLRSRVRGLQSHKHKVERVGPGNRVAVNLVGLSTDDLRRGQVLAHPGTVRTTAAVDVRLRAVPSLPRSLKHNTPVTFHTGSAEVPGKLRLLEAPELGPGEAIWAQIKLEAPVVVRKGDCFIVRTANDTVGGGEVVDPRPMRHRRYHEPTLERLETLQQGTPAEILLQALQRLEPVERKALLGGAGLAPAQAAGALDALLQEGTALAVAGNSGAPTSYLISLDGWRRLTERVQDMLGGYHRQHPLRLGMPKEELKSRLRLAPRLFNEVLARLVDENAVVEDRLAIRLPDFTVRLTPAQQREVDAYLARLTATPYSPPTDQPPAPELLQALIDQRQVVRVEDGVVFAAGAYDEMVARIVEHIKAHGKITVAEVRDLFGASRKYALALLEHLDQVKLTLRRGDDRVLR